MSQTLASPRLLHSPLLWCKRYVAGIIWTVAIAINVACFAFFAVAMLWVISDSADRVATATQEYGSVSPRGMAGRVSLASQETAR